MQQGYYSLPALLSALDAGKKVKYLWFWGHQPAANHEITASCFSQWWQDSPFTYDGITLARILAATPPAEAKKLGRQVTNFDEQRWQACCFDLVCEGNYHKFSQHSALKTFLLNTQPRILVEASPVDKIWGIGLAKDHPHAGVPSHWKGKNLLGFALMVVRDRLAEE